MPASAVKAPELADALVMIERDRQRAAREAQSQRGTLLSSGADVDLWTLGIQLVSAVLD